MTIPLKETNYIEKESSKPGNIKDKYFRQQDINNCLDECKKEIQEKSNYFLNNEKIFKIIDKWLKI